MVSGVFTSQIPSPEEWDRMSPNEAATGPAGGANTRRSGERQTPLAGGPARRSWVDDLGPGGWHGSTWKTCKPVENAQKYIINGYKRLYPKILPNSLVL